MPVDSSTVLYTPTETFHDEVYVPTDNTRSFSARYNVPVQAALDNAAWLKARVLDPPLAPLFGAQQADYATAAAGSPHVPRFIPWPGPLVTSPPPADFGRAGWLQSDVTDGGGLWWFVPIRFALKITMVAASIMGDDGPGINPGFPVAPDRPLLRLYKQPIDGSDIDLKLTLADETSSQGEYEAHHTIPLDPGTPFVTPLSFSAGEYLLIQFVGHKGASVAPKTLKLYGIKIYWEPS